MWRAAISPNRLLPVLVAILGLWCDAGAQDQGSLLGYRDAERVRESRRYSDAAIAVRLGGAFVWPEDTDLDEGREFEANPSGSVFAHWKNVLEDFSIDAYLGPDGGLISLYQRDGLQSLTGRLDVSARPLSIYRDGFYREDEFVPVGAYEGLDFGVFLAAEQRLVEDLTISVGPFYRRYDFDDRAGGVPGFVRPGDFNAHGLRAVLQYVDREPDRFHPAEIHDGVLASLQVDYESNDQRGPFGSPTFQSALPGSTFRGSLLIEIVDRVSEEFASQIRIEGALHERDDRIATADAQTPVGTAFVDGVFGLRYANEQVAITPYARVQFVRALDAFGQGSDDQAFFGGGIRGRWNLAKNLRLFFDASYLNNPGRPVVTWERGSLGEFQVVSGLEWTL